MRVRLNEVRCNGYASQHTDFGELYVTTPLSQDDINNLNVMIETAVSVERDPNSSSFCDITILGHSDRVDTSGLSSEQRRQMELDASTARAKSAQDWLFNEITNRLLAEGYAIPADLSSMQNVTIRAIPCGSADLEHKTPGNDEQKRRENRRLHILGVAYITLTA